MVKLRARCLLVGDAAVGKSALCQMFQSEGSVFQKNYSLTAGVELFTKCVSLPDSSDTVELYLLDSAGKDTLTDACEKMWGCVSLLLLVYDVCSEQSFLSCGRWLERAQSHCAGHTLSGVLVGNKCDLSERRTVQSTDAQHWAQSHGLEYFETSAKQLDSCTAPLMSLAQSLLSLYHQSCDRTLNLSLG